MNKKCKILIEKVFKKIYSVKIQSYIWMNLTEKFYLYVKVNVK